MKFRKSNPHAHNGKGDRPKGAKNRLQGDFVRALADDFAEQGADVIRIARIEEPVAYLKIVASLMPKELTMSTAVSDIPDDELDALIEQMRQRVLTERQEQALELKPEPLKVIAANGRHSS
jgi:hypothetical protein